MARIFADARIEHPHQAGERRHGTLYAEAQRRYLESVAPYARRLIDQAGVPEVDASIFLRLFWRAPRTCTQAGGPVCP
jgi:hypothetical protein